MVKTKKIHIILIIYRIIQNESYHSSFTLKKGLSKLMTPFIYSFSIFWLAVWVNERVNEWVSELPWNKLEKKKNYIFSQLWPYPKHSFTVLPSSLTQGDSNRQSIKSSLKPLQEVGIFDEKKKNKLSNEEKKIK